MKQSNLVEIQTQSRDGIPGVVTYGLQYLEGNSDAYFTLTAWYCGRSKRGDYKEEFGGQCHEEILPRHPELKPFADLHLSDTTGTPMHAEANGWYWLAGAIGGMGEQYHGASGSSAKTPEECLEIFAHHARVPVLEARALAEKLSKLSPPVAKQAFHEWIEAQRPRWQAEANAAIRLLPKK